MATDPLVDMSQFDFGRPMFTVDEIRRINPQRHEMEQLTAVVHVDESCHTIVGYKQVTDREFWIKGHMPDYPLMPGVVQCECAAQLGGFYARKYNLIGGDYLGFAGMDSIRFRHPIYPGCRLDLVAHVTRFRLNRMAVFQFQGFVDNQLMFEGRMLGVPVVRDSNA